MTNDASQILCVFSVIAGDDRRLLEIGKASPHQDGRGFDITLEALPICPRLVVRVQAEGNGQADGAESGQASYAQRVAAFERALIEQCLTETGGNIGGVMERLSIPRRTLSEKMQRLGIDRRRFVRMAKQSPSDGLAPAKIGQHDEACI